MSKRRAVPDTHDNTDLAIAARGPGHGASHYIPGDGFLVSNGGFSFKSKGTIYKEKRDAIQAKAPSAFGRMPDEGTYLSEEEVLEFAAAIKAHRKMTGAKSEKDAWFEEVRAKCHPGTDAIDSAKDGLHSQSDEFSVDRSRSTLRIGITTAGGPRGGVALNGSKVLHSSFVALDVTGPDGRRLCRVEMSPEQFAAALFGNSHTPCTLNSYWSLTDDSVRLRERVRPPSSIRKRMEKRLKHRLSEQAEALKEVANEMYTRAATGKAAGKTLQREWAEKIARACEYSSANSAFTIQQAHEEISSVMESAAIQFLAQQGIASEQLWGIAGPALGMDDDR